MANLQLAPASTSRTGLDITSSAALTVTTGLLGAQFLNNGQVALIIYNNSGSGLVVTEGAVSGANLPNLAPDGNPVVAPTVTIPTAKTWVLGPFRPSIYNAADGTVTCLFTGAATVFAALVQIPSLAGQ